MCDADELFNAERDLSTLRNQELLRKLIEGPLDFEYLQRIHRYLFQDIYDWVGEVRAVDIAKSNLFCRYFFTQNEMIAASAASFKLNYDPLQHLLASHLRPS